MTTPIPPGSAVVTPNDMLNEIRGLRHDVSDLSGKVDRAFQADETAKADVQELRGELTEVKIEVAQLRGRWQYAIGACAVLGLLLPIVVTFALRYMGSSA